MERSAGVVIVKSDPEGRTRMLCLRTYGSYDLPKGRLEAGESDLEAAKRETHEEAGIDAIEFPWGHEHVTVTKKGRRPKTVVLFLGISDQEPTIRKNPESGQFEHHGIAWLTLEEAEQRLHPYLRPVVGWVKSMLDR